MAGMKSLLDDGLIGAVGVSNYSLEHWRKADAALPRTRSSSAPPWHDLASWRDEQCPASAIGRWRMNLRWRILIGYGPD
jgi:aryl-alcohol dehydrogenase-like predicted oxidoreductase